MLRPGSCSTIVKCFILAAGEPETASKQQKMYTPRHNREEDQLKLYAFMKEYSFATLLTAKDDVPKGTHLPFLVEMAEGGLRLQAHMARANDQWRDFSETKEVLVIFQEPHGFVSPRHYEKQLSVPTWNYVAVHAYGHARLLDEPTEKYGLLERMIEEHDADYLRQWEQLPERFKREKLEGIVAFEIAVTRLQGRFKLSQDRTRAEQVNIINEFCRSQDALKSRVGEMMRENLKE
jgi:transcriptional regulator